MAVPVIQGSAAVVTMAMWKSSVNTCGRRGSPAALSKATSGAARAVRLGRVQDLATDLAQVAPLRRAAAAVLHERGPHHQPGGRVQRTKQLRHAQARLPRSLRRLTADAARVRRRGRRCRRRCRRGSRSSRRRRRSGRCRRRGRRSEQRICGRRGRGRSCTAPLRPRSWRGVAADAQPGQARRGGRRAEQSGRKRTRQPAAAGPRRHTGSGFCSVIGWVLRRPPMPRWCPVRARLFFTFLPNLPNHLSRVHPYRVGVHWLFFTFLSINH